MAQLKGRAQPPVARPNLEVITIITCIVGFPGSGKTTDAARRAHKFVKKSVKVYSNIPELTDTIQVYSNTP